MSLCLIAAACAEGAQVPAFEQGNGGPLVAADLRDEQILSVLVTANMSAIEQSTLAQPRITADDVRAYAADMVMAHQAAVERVSDVATSSELAVEDNEISELLRARSTATIQMLQQAGESAVDSLYLERQIDGDRGLLELIDTRLRRLAVVAQLQAEISTQRAEALDHLDRAIALSSTLPDADR